MQNKWESTAAQIVLNDSMSTFESLLFLSEGHSSKFELSKLLEDILVSLVLIPAARWISLTKDTFFFYKFGDTALHTLTIFSSVASNGATGCLSDIPLKCKLFPNKENELCLLCSLWVSPSDKLGSGGGPQSTGFPPTPTLLILWDHWISSISKSILSAVGGKKRYSFLSNLFSLLSQSLPQPVSFC